MGDAVTFAVSAATLAAIGLAAPLPLQAAPAVDAGRHVHPAGSQENAAGPGHLVDAPPLAGAGTFWGFLRSSPLARGVLLAAFVANLCFGGILDVALPVLIRGPAHEGSVGYGVVLADFGAGGLPVAVAPLGVMGLCNAPANVLFLTALRRRVPPEMLGRFMSAIVLVDFGPYPISAALAGLVLHRVGAARRSRWPGRRSSSG